MATLFAFCRNVFQNTYDAATASVLFGHRIVSSFIQVTGDCYKATATVINGLRSAMSDIAYYFCDLLVELGNVISVCLKFLGKFLVLIYHVVVSLSAGFVVGLEFVGYAISRSIAWICVWAKALADQTSKTWESVRPGLSKCAEETADSLKSLGGNIIDSASNAAAECLKRCVDFFNFAGETINLAILNIVECAYGIIKQVWNHFCVLLDASAKQLYNVWETCVVTPLCYTVKQFKDNGNALWDWLEPKISNIPTAVYFYILGTTIFIIVFKIVMGYMTQHGMSVPLFNFSASRLNQPVRRRHRILIESSDEDSMYEDDIEETNDADEESDEEGSRVPESELLDDDISVSDTDEDDFEEEEQEDPEEQDSESILDVEEFEIASDSDSDAGSEAPIQVELPERDEAYNLQNRMTPLYRGFSPDKLTPSQLERVLENERDKRLCVVCVDQPKNVLVLPCRHMCLCVDCAHEIVNQRTRARRVCPLCRSSIETVMNVYL